MNRGRVERGNGLVPEINFAYMTAMHEAATVSMEPGTGTGQSNWDTEVSAEVSGSQHRPCGVTWEGHHCWTVR